MFAKREVRCVNPECGTLNRVPRYSIKRIPECGKCHVPLPEHGAIKITRKLYRFRGPAILAVFAGVIAWGFRNEIRETINPAPACIVHASPRQGVYRWYTTADEVAPFTVSTAAGSNYYVKLEDATTHAPVTSFFIYGGSTLLNNKVPLGNYILKYASGQSWCNDRDLFGPDTAFNEARDVLAFTADGEGATGHFIKLILQKNGNLRTHTIPRSKF